MLTLDVCVSTYVDLKQERVLGGKTAILRTSWGEEKNQRVTKSVKAEVEPAVRGKGQERRRFVGKEWERGSAKSIEGNSMMNCICNHFSRDLKYHMKVKNMKVPGLC